MSWIVLQMIGINKRISEKNDSGCVHDILQHRLEALIQAVYMIYCNIRLEALIQAVYMIYCNID
jgi:hypothetical protein